MTIEEKARGISRGLFEEKHGKRVKIGLWICGNLKLSCSEETKCTECGKICYYDREMLSKSKKDTKFICQECALKNHRNELNEKEILILGAS